MLARLLRLLPPETAHAVALRGLARGLPRVRLDADPRLATRLFGRTLPHPVGLAAGFDKDALAVAGLFGLGFAFVEVGTVTPKPQPGNPRPRLFRLAADRALINRMGFNNAGHAAARRRLDRLADRPGAIGVNLGVNKGSDDPAADYAEGLRRFAAVADYLVVNVSSPNTPGLRDLQAIDALDRIVDRLLDARRALRSRTPVLIKVAPDQTLDQATAIADLAMARGLDGLILTNTTVARPDSLGSRHRAEPGGLSGRPLFVPSTDLLRGVFQHAGTRLPLIGVGGIDSPPAAYAKIRAGASAVQLYTGLIYDGPFLVRRIVRGLAQLMDRDGAASLAEVRGVDA